MSSARTIDEYLADQSGEIQKLLHRIRKTIAGAAPDATEAIKYGMPTFVFHGNLVHFAACKNHIGFYPAPSAITKFRKALSAYSVSKGAVQFPLDKVMPIDLITRIVKFRVQENLKKALIKALRTCRNGHQFYKTSDCPTCPICEQQRKPKKGFLSLLSAPARRALENKGISSLKQLSKFSEQEILNLHGMGKSSMPKLRNALAVEKLRFKK